MIINDEKYIDELRKQLENIHESKNKNIISLCGRISEDLKSGSAEDRQKLLDDIKRNDSDSDLVDGLSGCIAALLDAFLIFEACDCPRNAKNMITIMMLVNVFSESVEKYVDVAFRAEKSKAKKEKQISTMMKHCLSQKTRGVNIQMQASLDFQKKYMLICVLNGLVYLFQIQLKHG
ncbi:hypothetical protein G9400_03190 [Klebsiella michiganensis]|nr:hypothetical protein [Klebsiella michiganensis]